MTNPVQKLVAADQEFNKIETDLQATISKTKTAVLELIADNNELTQQNQQLTQYIGQLEDSTPDPEPSPPIQETHKLSYSFSDYGENKGWGDTITIPTTATNSKLNDSVITCGGRSGVITFGEVPLFVDWRRLTFLQGSYPTGWGASLQRVSGLIEKCQFLGLGRREWTVTDNLVDGHPLYLKIEGLLELIDCTFSDCAGNTQITARPWEGVVAPKLTINVEGSVWSNCSWNPTGHGGGGSSNLAIYSASDQGTEIRLTDCLWVNSITYPGREPAKTGASARGCVAVWNEAYYPHPSKNLAPDADKYFSLFEMKDCTIRTTAADRPLIIIDGAREINISGLRLEWVKDNDHTGPTIQIDKDPDNPQRAKRIYIEPINRPGFIKVGDQTFPLAEGYDWTEPGYTPEFV